MIPYQAFMKNAALRKNVFRPNGENDHEHCVMCGAKFSIARRRPSRGLHDIRWRALGLPGMPERISG